MAMETKIRTEKNAILLYNGDDAHTAYVSGKELDLLRKWLTHNIDTAFTLRLKRMGLLDDAMRDVLADVMRNIDNVNAPLRSLSIPESLHIELTAEAKPTNRGKRILLPYNRYSEILAEAETIGVLQIDLGGEPLKHPHLAEAVEEAYGRGMSVVIHSSGAGFDKALAERLAGHARLQISLNGSTAQIHELSCNGYDDTIAALRFAAGAKLSFGINWVARQDNLDDFPALITLASSFGADNVTVLRYQPCSREPYADIALTGSRLLKLAEIIKSTKRMAIRLDSAFSNLNSYIYKNLETKLCGCGAGRRFITMDASGNFCPCKHIRLSSDGGTILDYWQNSPQLADFRALEDRIGEECRNCQHLANCRGCRAITTYLTRFEDGEKNCIFAKKL